MTETEQRIHDCLDSREGERGWVTLMAPDVRAMLADRDEREAKLRAEVDEALGEIEAFAKENDTLRHQVIACGVAASHPDVNLSRTGAYAGKWNSQQAESVRNLRAERDAMAKALTFYATQEHFILSDDTMWDTVSGEPPNWWCDEAGTATVEDGSIARLVLAGGQSAADVIAQIENEKANGSR